MHSTQRRLFAPPGAFAAPESRAGAPPAGHGGVEAPASPFAPLEHRSLPTPEQLDALLRPRPRTQPQQGPFARLNAGVPVVSPSQINLVLQCPQAWYAKYHLCEEDKPSAASLAGQACHLAIEHHLRGVGANECAQFASIATGWAVRNLAPDERNAVQASHQARRRVASITAWIAQAGITALEVEHDLVYLHATPHAPGKVEVAMRVDCLARDRDGRYVVLDWKFSSRVPAFPVREEYLFATTMYALAYRRRGIPVERAILVYAGPDGELANVEHQWGVDDQADRTLRRLDDGIAAIQAATWETRKSPLCKWCSHKPACSAWPARPNP